MKPSVLRKGVARVIIFSAFFFLYKSEVSLAITSSNYSCRFSKGAHAHYSSLNTLRVN